MSSIVCRCYDGVGCPATAAGAEDFFAEIPLDNLSNAVVEAIKDYVQLRGLRGLCPDVRKWGPPPGPAAFLDGGLPKSRGSGSLAQGLSEDFDDLSQTGRSKSRETRGSTRGRNDSIPSPTWEEVGPEGSVRQVVSFDEDGEIGADRAEETVQATSTVHLGSDSANFLDHSRMTTGSVIGGRPSAGDGEWDKETPLTMSAFAPEPTKKPHVAERMSSELPSVDAKQLLRSLRQESKGTRHRYLYRSSRSSRQTDSPGGLKGNTTKTWARPFSPPDEWDDTGIFTVAPRPKSVPCGTSSRLHNNRQKRHALEKSGVGVSSSASVPTLPHIQASHDGAFTSKLSDIELCNDPFWLPSVEVGRMRGMEGAIGAWSTRRREHGGGRGDAAVEFLDVREAALVSVAEALARRALPWQAQLCPRALQDLEIARVKVFHSVERNRGGACKGRMGAILRGLLLSEERSWEHFADEQGRLFEKALEQMNILVHEWQESHVIDLRTRQEKSDKRVKQAEEQNRCHIDLFEDNEQDRTWLHRRSILADMMWDPSAVCQAREAEEQRATEARGRWSRGEIWGTVRDDAFAWAEAAGAHALTAEELVRWEGEVFNMTSEDEGRAAGDRARELQRSTESYGSVLQEALDAEKAERSVTAEAWNLQGWLSVGSHKLVQQTLRALLRNCSHPYEVRNVLWEARQAAEFAASARAAAAAQRTGDAKEMCNARRSHKATVREHRKGMIQAEEKRSGGEDRERRQTAEQIVAGVRDAASQKVLEAKEQFQRERARVLRSRKEETERSLIYREEASILARELDKEADRVASSVKDKRAEDDECLRVEVATASASLQEEQAKADNRELILHEILLLERDKEDRLLKDWLLQREEEERYEILRFFEEFRRSVEVERERWTQDLRDAVAEAIDIDTSTLKDLTTWRIRAASAKHSGVATQSSLEHSDSLTEAAIAPSREKFDAIWACVMTRAEANRCELESKIQQWVGTGTSQRTPAAAETEELAANTRFARLQALAVLNQEGRAAQWSKFWQSEIERGKLAAVAGDLAVFRWLQRQHEAASAFWATWRNRQWKISSPVSNESEPPGDATIYEPHGKQEVQEAVLHATRPPDTQQAIEDEEDGISAQRSAKAGPDEATTTSGHRTSGDASENVTTGDSQNVAVTLTSGEEEGKGAGTIPLVKQGLERVSAATGTSETLVLGELSEKENGGDVERTTAEIDDGHDGVIADESNAASQPGADGSKSGAGALRIDLMPKGNNQAVADKGRAAPIDDCDVNHHAGGDNISSAVSELVVFVGCSTALHLSTLPLPSCTEYVDLRRSSCVRLQTASTPEEGDRENAVVEREREGTVDNSETIRESNDHESEWLEVLKVTAGQSEVVDLPTLGATLGNISGGAAVLCLAHDCAVFDIDGKFEGLVRTQVLVSATEALAKARRRMHTALISEPASRLSTCRTAVGGIGTQETAEEKTLGAGSDVVHGVIDAHVLDAITMMEATLEMDVIGDELCDDLCTVWARKSGNDVQSRRFQANSVAGVLSKHGMLLSPSCIWALTALLCARGPSAETNNEGSSTCPLEPSKKAVQRPATDAEAWRVVAMDSLTQIRRAALEHAVMWATLCHPERVEAACKADAECLAESDRCTEPVGQPHINEAAVRDRITTEAAMWRALHKVSGLGLSPLLLVAAMLPKHDDRPRDIIRSYAKKHHSSDEQRGRRLATEDCTSPDLHAIVTALLELLSPESLKNVARNLSFDSPRIYEDGEDGSVSGNRRRSSRAKSPAVSTPDIDSETNSDRTPELLSLVPEHPAIENLPRLDPNRLAKGVAGILTALDAADTGALPATEILLALQGGTAGFSLESGLADAVIRLSGCFEVDGSGLTQTQKQLPHLSTTRHQGGYSYLGYSPGTSTIQYGALVRKIPSIMRLMQAAHRFKRATGKAANIVSAVDAGTLERKREMRRLLAGQRGPVSLTMALETVQQRMIYLQHERRTAMIEVPRLQAMRRASAQSQEKAYTAARERELEALARTESRVDFVSALQERITAVGVGLCTTQRGIVTAELWEAASMAMVQARDGLTRAVEQMGAMITDAEEAFRSQELTRISDDEKAQRLDDEEPDWWGEGLRREVEEAYRQEALWGQETAEDLAEEEAQMEKDMSAAWEEDAMSCKDMLPEIAEKLETVMVEFDQRRALSRRASPGVRKTPASEASQAGFAGEIQSRHEEMVARREVLAWLGKATESLEAECAFACETSASLPVRTEQRLSTVLASAAASATQKRSLVARRLQSVSGEWGAEVPKRKQRWDKIREERRTARQHTRDLTTVNEERATTVGPLASTARSAFLAEAVEFAGIVIRDFSANANKARNAVKAEESALAAAEKMGRAHEAVILTLESGGATQESTVELHRKEQSSEGNDSGATVMLDITRKDATERVRTCGDEVGQWWARQVKTAEEALRLRETELHDRRIRREVPHLVNDCLVAEIEARQASNALMKDTLSRVLVESQRVASQFLAAEKSAAERASVTATEARAAAAKETEVLSLESNALLGRVSVTLQRVLNTAREDLAGCAVKRGRKGQLLNASESDNSSLGTSSITQSKSGTGIRGNSEDDESATSSLESHKYRVRSDGDKTGQVVEKEQRSTQSFQRGDGNKGSTGKATLGDVGKGVHSGNDEGSKRVVLTTTQGWRRRSIEVNKRDWSSGGG